MYYNYETWYRHGRGRGIDCFICDSELIQFFTEDFPDDYEPTSIIRVYLKKVQTTYREFYVEEKRSDIGKLLKYETSHLFLRNHKITPELPLETGEDFSGLLATNGLIIIQYHSKYKNSLDAFSLGIVNRIINDDTGEIVTHEEYEELFLILKRKLKKLLYYTTIEKLPGREEEELKSILMSEQFAEACTSGKIVCPFRPGKRVRKLRKK